MIKFTFCHQINPFQTETQISLTSIRLCLQLHPARRTKKKDCETGSRRARKMTRACTVTVGMDRVVTSLAEAETVMPRHDPTRTSRPVHRPSQRSSSTKTSTRGSLLLARICCSRRAICRRRNPGLVTQTPALRRRPPRANPRLIPPQVEV